jgi:hypothetical protein
MRFFLSLLSFSVMLFLQACTHTTEVYLYDDKGVERKIARIVQEDDGIAIYEAKDRYIITVDTRYKANTGSEPVTKIIDAATSGGGENARK